MAAWLTCPASGNPCPHTGDPCRYGLCLVRDSEPRRAPLDTAAPHTFKRTTTIRCAEPGCSAVVELGDDHPDFIHNVLVGIRDWHAVAIVSKDGKASIGYECPRHTDLGRLGRMATPHVPAPLPSRVRWLVMALMVAASLGFIAATFLMVRG